MGGKTAYELRPWNAQWISATLVSGVELYGRVVTF